jgi:hypothetical protein
MPAHPPRDYGGFRSQRIAVARQGSRRDRGDDDALGRRAVRAGDGSLARTNVKEPRPMSPLRKKIFQLTIAGAIVGSGAAAEAQNVPPAAPIGPAPTLWHYLGLRQGSWQWRDNFRNRSGNRPGRERKPPLKRIADPALADVDNAAIKKAQQIKAEEDLAPQKIKAIKYLATLGCEKCYGGIEEAMLESLKDCTEEVRYETVKALGTIPNKECPQCDNDCCTEKMTEQLAKMAYERDPDHPDCWYEPSARIREEAKKTMSICCPNRQPPPGVVTEGNGGAVEPPVEPPVEPGVEPGRTPPPTPQPRSAARPTHKTARHTYNIFDSLTQRKPSAARQATAGPVHKPAGPSVIANAQSPKFKMEERTVAVSDMPTDEVVVEAGDQSATESSATVDARAVSSAASEEITTLRQPRLESPAPPTGIEESPAPTAEPEAAAATDEAPALQPVIRQPSNLTRRAQRPALIAARPDETASSGIQQPSSFGAVKRISAEEPADETIAEEPAEASTPAVQSQEVHASDQHAARAQQSKQHGSPVGNFSGSANTARGSVARVTPSAGVAQLRFAGGSQPAVGSHVQVLHRYLMKTAPAGELEIIAVGDQFVTAKAVGDTNLSKIGSGDVVVLQTR